MGDTVRRPLLNESERPTRTHFIIPGMSWAGWLFDFYDLMLFAFLLVPIKKSLGLDDVALSLLLGAPRAAPPRRGRAGAPPRCCGPAPRSVSRSPPWSGASSSRPSPRRSATRGAGGRASTPPVGPPPPCVGPPPHPS